MSNKPEKMVCLLFVFYLYVDDKAMTAAEKVNAELRSQGFTDEQIRTSMLLCFHAFYAVIQTFRDNNPNEYKRPAKKRKSMLVLLFSTNAAMKTISVDDAPTTASAVVTRNDSMPLEVPNVPERMLFGWSYWKVASHRMSKDVEALLGSSLQNSPSNDGMEVSPSPDSPTRALSASEMLDKELPTTADARDSMQSLQVELYGRA